MQCMTGTHLVEAPSRLVPPDNQVKPKQVRDKVGARAIKRASSRHSTGLRAQHTLQARYRSNRYTGAGQACPGYHSPCLESQRALVST